MGRNRRSTPHVCRRSCIVQLRCLVGHVSLAESGYFRVWHVPCDCPLHVDVLRDVSCFVSARWALRPFEAIRTPFFTIVLLYAILEVPLYELADFDRPSFYWYTFWPTVGLVIAAMVIRRKLLDAFVAAHWIVQWGGWWFVAKLQV